MAPIRFWGTVLSVRPRLILAKFEEETEVRCPGFIATLDGTTTEGSERPVPGVYTVVIGPATYHQREIRPGDLLRGDAHRVPEGLPDTPADLYKVGVLRQIARAENPPASDPPRTDPPLTEESIGDAPRRPLAPENLENGGACAHCPYGVQACVVRLSDPRDWRRGEWRTVPACLGPEECPHFVPPGGW